MAPTETQIKLQKRNSINRRFELEFSEEQDKLFQEMFPGGLPDIQDKA